MGKKEGDICMTVERLREGVHEFEFFRCKRTSDLEEAH